MRFLGRLRLRLYVRGATRRCRCRHRADATRLNQADAEGTFIQRFIPWLPSLLGLGLHTCPLLSSFGWGHSGVDWFPRHPFGGIEHRRRSQGNPIQTSPEPRTSRIPESDPRDSMTSNLLVDARRWLEKNETKSQKPHNPSDELSSSSGRENDTRPDTHTPSKAGPATATEARCNENTSSTTAEEEIEIVYYYQAQTRREHTRFIDSVEARLLEALAPALLSCYRQKDTTREERNILDLGIDAISSLPRDEIKDGMSTFHFLSQFRNIFVNFFKIRVSQQCTRPSTAFRSKVRIDWRGRWVSFA